ncbi:hypothetical protein T484DRAFT_1802619 [Baffinella frigidus]|nr:hypothetical protein T484DRAFT_1802619 [Cryptophyta sp. CCMP2293]
MPPPRLPAGWKEYEHDNGKIFYYNAATGNALWERPVRGMHGEEEEEEEEEDDDGRGMVIRDIDIPQAFSHFTYIYTKRKKLVCDLQGVLNEACTPPLFELTDPVIHYKSDTGRSKVTQNLKP